MFEYKRNLNKLIIKGSNNEGKHASRFEILNRPV